MFKTEESQDDFYLVECADWQSIVLAANYTEAASLALKEIIQKQSINTKVSFIISVKKALVNSNKIEFLHTAEILMDLGHYKLATDLYSISNFVLDKGETPY